MWFSSPFLAPLTPVGVFTQGGTQRRVEKAEILEHTVLFLQGIAKGDGGDGGQKRSFQDGVSTCLHRATQFLGPDGKGLWLGVALDASVAARFSRSDSGPEGAQRRTEGCSSGSLPHSKSILQMLRQKSKHARAFGANGRAPAGQRLSRTPQRAQRQNQLESSNVEGRARKQSPSQSRPVDQALWRPWP